MPCPPRSCGLVPWFHHPPLCRQTPVIGSRSPPLSPFPALGSRNMSTAHTVEQAEFFWRPKIVPRRRVVVLAAAADKSRRGRVRSDCAAERSRALTACPFCSVRQLHSFSPPSLSFWQISNPCSLADTTTACRPRPRPISFIHTDRVLYTPLNTL